MAQAQSNPTTAVYTNAATPGQTPPADKGSSRDELAEALWNDLRNNLQETQGEVAERNQTIADRDAYVYGDKLKQALDIPVGHDFTPVNWLKRTVEIHKTQFMGRPFHVLSTYNAKDLSTAADDKEKERLKIENKKQKATAELREDTIRAIIRDNGGHSLFAEGAESASVVGDWVVKTWYDEDNAKFVISPVEAVEHCYAAWSQDDFRQHDIFAYAYQVSKAYAISRYGVDDKVATSPIGNPLEAVAGAVPLSQPSNQAMVSIMEATGKIPGWCAKKGKIAKCARGEENEINVLFVGNKLQRVIDDPKKLPKYYIFPNKKARRRAWGLSDITDAAISLNLTYIETLSDWRTISNKVNFPKFKGFNFGPDVQLPKFKSRQIQMLPLSEGQDIGVLPMGDSGAVDFRSQLEEIKEQFVRETGVAQVLLDNSGVSLNSNQALITSMKPTSDIAENKKELWSPILVQMFSDAFETLAAYDKETYGDLADDTDPWTLRVQWPSAIQKEDPIYQQMLLNRWNSRTMSLQSFLEAQGESSEEIDRMRDEMADELTAAIHANQLPMVYTNAFAPPAEPEPKVSVNLRGDLSPNQEANLASKHGFNDGPFEPSMVAQGYGGMRAQENEDNKGLLKGTYPNETPIQVGTDGQEIQATPAQNTPGTQPVSQPGSGATPVSPQGAVNQTNQNQGR